MNVVTEIAESIDEMLGDHDWTGNRPYCVQIVDTSSGKAYSYELRRGDDWITIMEKKLVNHFLNRAFNLQREEDGWKYLDTYLEKYDESSLPKLQEAYERLKIAVEASKPTLLEDAEFSFRK